MYKRTINKKNIKYLCGLEIMKKLITIIKKIDKLKCIKVEDLYLLILKSKDIIKNENLTHKLSKSI